MRRSWEGFVCVCVCSWSGERLDQVVPCAFFCCFCPFRSENKRKVAHRDQVSAAATIVDGAAAAALVLVKGGWWWRRRRKNCRHDRVTFSFHLCVCVCGCCTRGWVAMFFPNFPLSFIFFLSKSDNTRFSGDFFFLSLFFFIFFPKQISRL